MARPFSKDRPWMPQATERDRVGLWNWSRRYRGGAEAFGVVVLFAYFLSG